MKIIFPALIVLTSFALVGCLQIFEPAVMVDTADTVTDEVDATEDPVAEDILTNEDTSTDAGGQAAVENLTPAENLTPVESLTPPVPAQMTMEIGNVFFRPTRFTVKQNQPITVDYTNSGTHTFTIDELNVNVGIGNASGSFSFIPTKKGTFGIYCATPGHKEAGMVGTITVE